MSELEDRINSVLSDPEQMARISEMAKNLMGGGSSGEKQEQKPQSGGIGQILGDGFDPAMLMKIKKLMDGGSGSKYTALFEAMKPYLSEKRRGKLDRAVQIARLARIARIAMEEGGFHV